MTAKREQVKPPSLENLIEDEDIGLEVLHPGGLDITRELAQLCHISLGSKVLEVASGTGESACFLVQNFGCSFVGIDASDRMIERAKSKVSAKGLPAEFKKGDAHHLPFDDGTFDAVVSECTVCILDKAQAIREMARVTKSGGYVGIHDLCWKEGAPEDLQRRLVEIEGERPETLEGWRRLFEEAGLKDIRAIDKSDMIPRWSKEIKKKLGIMGQLKIFFKVIRTWGFSGFKTIIESERIFQSKYTGYGILIGRKA